MTAWNFPLAMHGVYHWWESASSDQEFHPIQSHTDNVTELNSGQNCNIMSTGNLSFCNICEDLVNLYLRKTSDFYFIINLWTVHLKSIDKPFVLIVLLCTLIVHYTCFYLVILKLLCEKVTLNIFKLHFAAHNASHKDLTKVANLKEASFR